MAQSTDTALRSQLANGSLAGAWTLDPARSSVTFRTKSMWGMAKIKGTFATVSGHGLVSDSGGVSGALTIDVASLDTENKKRDEHLRSAAILDAGAHPQITFETTRVEVTGDGLLISGALQVHGHTEVLTFPATVSLEDGAAIVSAELDVDRSVFGVSWSPMRVASLVNNLAISAVFTR
jgi:polyisoprenoid-binding protein YceI